MRTSEAARYARWAASAALLLAVGVGGVFAYRSWEAARTRRQAPPAVPPTVQQRSAEFSFSKVEKDRTLFTVRASRATEFKEGNRNLLEDVRITIYGRAGQRFDNIHTRACDYLRDTGRIVCAGEVQIDLQSAEDARPGGVGGQSPESGSARRIVHVGTKNVSFDRETGEARTDQPVVLRFPYGEGRAVGVTYRSGDGVVRLGRDVELTLARPPVPEAPAHQPRNEQVRLTGGSLEYRRDTRTMRLLAPVRAWQGQRELMAGELALALDADLRPERLVATRQPELRTMPSRGQVALSAHEFAAFFNPEGWTERLVATGSVRGTRKSDSAEDHVTADRIEVEMLPRRNLLRTLIASGGVRAQSNRSGQSQQLETSALRLFFVSASESNQGRLDRAESLGPATLEWSTEVAGSGKAAMETTRVRGQQVSAEFDERNQLRQLIGRNGVETERRLPGQPPQVVTSRELVAKFEPRGTWTEVEQSGDVRVREAARTARAEHARLERTSGRIRLTGSVMLSDPLTRTSASSLSFSQRTGEIRADGDVRTSYQSAERNGITNLSPQPAHISSDLLLASSTGGRAVYSGHARLWQGDAVMEADSIELLRDARQLNARGNLFAVFPQSGGGPGVLPAAPARAPRSLGRTAGPGLDLWRVRAGALTYWSAEGRVLLVQNVSAQSQRGQINSTTLELFLSSAGSPSESGPQQVSRALASGGVSVRQGERRGTAERAEYTAAKGEFVLSGGHPTLYDGSRGTISGHQLTFNFADDTIVVDSEKGSRTLTRHRVEK